MRDSQAEAYTNPTDLDRSPTTVYQQFANHCMHDGIYPSLSTGTVADNIPPEWSPDMQYEARKTAGRPTGSDISDRSEATASSRSDASIAPRVHVNDLQGLSLGDSASHVVLPYGASSHSHRDDPIRGDAQRKYDREVVSNILYFLFDYWLI